MDIEPVKKGKVMKHLSRKTKAKKIRQTTEMVLPIKYAKYTIYF